MVFARVSVVSCQVLIDFFRFASALLPLLSSAAVALAQPVPASSSVHLIYYMAWTNLYQFICNLGLFWADLIPDFGMYVAVCWHC
mgnify:CR=1 FL=1